MSWHIEKIWYRLNCTMYICTLYILEHVKKTCILMGTFAKGAEGVNHSSIKMQVFFPLRNFLGPQSAYPLPVCGFYLIYIRYSTFYALSHSNFYLFLCLYLYIRSVAWREGGHVGQGGGGVDPSPMKMHFFPFQNFLVQKNIHKCRDEDPDPDQVGSVDFCAAGSRSGSVTCFQRIRILYL